jgi:hypothetical protein
MICKLCQKHFLDESSFLGIFIFNDLCYDCRITYQPHIMVEDIPIDYGFIHYAYLYEDISFNQHYHAYLSRHLDRLYRLFIHGRINYDLVIYLDDDAYFNSRQWVGLIQDYNNVFVFTLARKEIIYLWDF